MLSCTLSICKAYLQYGLFGKKRKKVDGLLVQASSPHMSTALECTIPQHVAVMPFSCV